MRSLKMDTTRKGNVSLSKCDMIFNDYMDMNVHFTAEHIWVLSPRAYDTLICNLQISFCFQKCNTMLPVWFGIAPHQPGHPRVPPPLPVRGGLASFNPSPLLVSTFEQQGQQQRLQRMATADRVWWMSSNIDFHSDILKITYFQVPSYGIQHWPCSECIGWPQCTQARWARDNQINEQNTAQETEELPEGVAELFVHGGWSLQ